MNVGDIEEVDAEILRVLLEKRFVPVVASLGADREGRVLNINADTIAAEIAAALPAEKLFLMSNVAGSSATSAIRRVACRTSPSRQARS